MCIWILFTSAKFILNWNLIIILYSLFSSFQEYYKVLEEADEKVQLANQIYDLVRITGQDILSYFWFCRHIVSHLWYLSFLVVTVWVARALFGLAFSFYNKTAFCIDYG